MERTAGWGKTQLSPGGIWGSARTGPWGSSLSSPHPVPGKEMPPAGTSGTGPNNARRKSCPLMPPGSAPAQANLAGEPSFFTHHPHPRGKASATQSTGKCAQTQGMLSIQLGILHPVKKTREGERQLKQPTGALSGKHSPAEGKTTREAIIPAEMTGWTKRGIMGCLGRLSILVLGPSQGGCTPSPSLSNPSPLTSGIRTGSLTLLGWSNPSPPFLPGSQRDPTAANGKNSPPPYRQMGKWRLPPSSHCYVQWLWRPRTLKNNCAGFKHLIQALLFQ